MPAASRNPADPQLADWHTRLMDIHDRSIALVQPLSAGARTRAPSDGAWSVDQVLEHLAIANELYALVMQRALTVQATRATASHRAWKPTFVGGLLRRALEPTSARRLRSPQRARPVATTTMKTTAQSGAPLLARYSDSVTSLASLMNDADGVDLRAVRFPSPFASFLRLNLGDGFIVCVTHMARHLQQIERTIKANGRVT